MAQTARRVFGSHRQVGASKKRRRALEIVKADTPKTIPYGLYHRLKESGITPPAPPGKQSFGLALQDAAQSKGVTCPIESRVVHSRVAAPYLKHHVRIPSKDTWSVIDDDTKELLGTYSTGSAANGASAYFARFGHKTLVRRVL